MSTFTQVSITRMPERLRRPTIREQGLDEKRGVRFAARMRIGVYVSPAGTGSISELLGRFAAAEAAGFATAWSGQVFAHDLLTLLALAGRATRRIEIGAWVVPTPVRHPAALAQHAITAQLACGGRLALGLGVSHDEVIGRRFGIADPRPLSHLAEVLDVLQPLLRAGAVSHTGARYRVEIALERHGAAPPPILLGALGPRMLALAGSRCEGAALWLVGPRTLATSAMPALRRAAAAAGRPSPRIAAALPIALCDDPLRARAAIDAFLAAVARLPAYRRALSREGAARPSDVAIAGGEAVLASALDRLAELGVTDFNAVLVPIAGDPECEARTRAWLAARARASG
jgi:F420-dependent oxidoreductase-like protein